MAKKTKQKYKYKKIGELSFDYVAGKVRSKEREGEKFRISNIFLDLIRDVLEVDIDVLSLELEEDPIKITKNEEKGVFTVYMRKDLILTEDEILKELNSLSE